MYKEFCSIAVQTDDFGCGNGCTSMYINTELLADLPNNNCSISSELDPNVKVKVEKHSDSNINADSSNCVINHSNRLSQLEIGDVVVKFEDILHQHGDNTDMFNSTSSTIPEHNTEQILINVEHRFDYSVITESCDFPNSSSLSEDESNNRDVLNFNGSESMSTAGQDISKSIYASNLKPTDVSSDVQCHVDDKGLQKETLVGLNYSEKKENYNRVESDKSLSNNTVSIPSTSVTNKDMSQEVNGTQTNDIRERLTESSVDASSAQDKNTENAASSECQADSNENLKCSYCLKEFKYRFVLNEHIRKHTGEKPYECTYCNKKFPRKGPLKSHIRLHTGEKPFHCQCCEQKFSSYNYLFKHLRKEHPEQKNQACPHCDQRFHTKIELRKHILAEKHLDCSYCGKTFSMSSLLKQHVRTHTGEKPFSCEQCGKKFTMKKTLNEHLRVHSGKRLFVCTYCEKKFTAKVSFDRHIRIHTGEKPYECSFCKKTFAEQSNLRRHLVTHTGEKKVSCSMCDKKFARLSYLKLHLRTHTGERPFQCPHCDLKFGGRSNMSRHISRKHSNKK